MANSIAGAVAALKNRVGEFLSESFVACLGWESGSCWRDTPLVLPNLVALFARQILDPEKVTFHIYGARQGNATSPSQRRSS